MSNQKNALNWFELFVNDFSRARKFYEQALNCKLEAAQMEGCEMGMFPCDENNGVGGAITKMEDFKPGPGGTVVYLNVEGQLDNVLQRIPEAGGKILRPRQDISPHGYIAIFEDSEGNVVGLHSLS
jgi:uncharacterized protein